MAKKSSIVKTERAKEKLLKSLAEGKTPYRATKTYNRCKLCGRNRGYMRRFSICRICFRELARAGKIMGLKKSSW